MIPPFFSSSPLSLLDGRWEESACIIIRFSNCSHNDVFRCINLSPRAQARIWNRFYFIRRLTEIECLLYQYVSSHSQEWQKRPRREKRKGEEENFVDLCSQSTLVYYHPLHLSFYSHVNVNNSAQYTLTKVVLRTTRICVSLSLSFALHCVFISSPHADVRWLFNSLTIKSNNEVHEKIHLSSILIPSPSPSFDCKCLRAKRCIQVVYIDWH